MASSQRLSIIAKRANSTSSNDNRRAFDYCVNVVKRRSYEQYLSTLLLPPKTRRAGFVIRAFNAEIAGVRDQVTAKHAGMGRMVFWRDLIEKLFSSEKAIPNHPVAKELQVVIAEGQLSKSPFVKMIESRDVFIEDDIRPPFFNMDDVETYSEKAFSSVYYLLMESLSEGKLEINGHARHAANQLGKTEGVVTLLRGIPHNAARLRKVYIPVSSLADHQVSSETIIRNTVDKEALGLLIESIAARADDHLQNARFRSKHLNKNEKLVLLPAVTADRFLTRLQRAKCDVFHPELNTRDSWLSPLLYWNKLKSTF